MHLLISFVNITARCNYSLYIYIYKCKYTQRKFHHAVTHKCSIFLTATHSSWLAPRNRSFARAYTYFSPALIREIEAAREKANEGGSKRKTAASLRRTSCVSRTRARRCAGSRCYAPPYSNSPSRASATSARRAGGEEGRGEERGAWKLSVWSVRGRRSGSPTREYVRRITTRIMMPYCLQIRVYLPCVPPRYMGIAREIALSRGNAPPAVRIRGLFLFRPRAGLKNRRSLWRAKSKHGALSFSSRGGKKRKVEMGDSYYARVFDPTRPPILLRLRLAYVSYIKGN